MNVLVTHPGLQHSHQLALALYEAGHLLAFWSGVPLADIAHPSRGWGRLSKRVRQTEIPASDRSHPVVFPVLRRIASQVLPPASANSIIHRLDHIFDRWAALHVTRLKPDVVVCYENAALHTFRAAKHIGALCVLDAASLHHNASADLLGSVVGRDPSWVERQKDQEINLADAIMVCSPFAGESYVAAGVAKSKVKLCELGIDGAPSNRRSRQSSTDKCRFLFVGSIRRLKGVDVLLDVFEELHRAGASATLTLLGGAAERDLATRARHQPGVRYLPFVEKPALYDVMAEHDCLILPSRMDSFGLVVPEAMTIGLPAIVSDRTGAKSIIERNPGSGWIVPFDPMALRNLLRRLIDDRQQLATASLAAIKAAEAFSGAAYRARAVDLLRDIYRSHTLVRISA
jgi:glycosyltransferase involved in cell wall biosynthesis